MRLFWLVLAIMLVVGMLPLLAILGFSLAGMDPLVRASAEQSLGTIVSQAASEVSLRVESAYNTVELLGADPLVRSSGVVRDAREAALRSAMVLNPTFVTSRCST